MNYEEALKIFSDSYLDRYSVEFPTIFSIVNFDSKTVLEIGSAEGYFVKEASRIAKSVRTSDSFYSLPFDDNFFDIVLSRWVIQNVEDVEKLVREMCRVAKENVIIILPSDGGDETRILSIKFHDKFRMRKERIEKIKKLLSESGFKVKEEKNLLNFRFKDVNTAVEVFYNLGFKGSLADDEIDRLKKFLSERQKENGVHITQGASYICGYK